MARGKAGRKRKPGERFPSGKLRQAYDYGCDGVIRRRATYAPRPANDRDKVDTGQTYDAIGRAWSAGLLVIAGRDPVVVRDAGRDLGALYWRIYGLGSRDSLARFQAQTAGLTGRDREKALEDALNRRLEMIGRSGSPIRSAIDSLCIGDGMHFDDGPPWLDDLIWARRHGKPARVSSERTMELALTGLAAIV